jgi:SPP1 family predicted phage head-tail adaptor
MMAGKLDQRVTVQLNTPTRNSRGEQIDSWANSWTDWAEAITKGGGEYYAAQKLNASTEVVFRMRYKAALAASNASAIYRITWLSRTFQILNINLGNGQRRELLMSCKEVV